MNDINRKLRENITTIQWGQNGCFLTLKYDRISVGPLALGSRVDIKTDLTVPLGKSAVYTLPIMGTWYVYEIKAQPLAELSTVTLIRQPNLHRYGDGTTWSMKRVADLYSDFDVFRESDIDYYFTWTNNVRMYRTVVKLASKIKVNKIPVFELNGKLSLYNLEDVRKEDIMLRTVPLTYPPVKENYSQANYDYFLYSRMGNTFKIPETFLRPGWIYRVKLSNPHYAYSRPYEGDDYLVRDVIIYKNSSNTFTADSYASPIMERSVYGDSLFPKVVPIAPNISDHEEEHFARYNPDMTLKEENSGSSNSNQNSNNT